MAGKQSKAQKAAAQIAEKVLGIETLEDRHSDRLDFYDLHVASIRQALVEAFEAGKATTK